MSGRSPPRMKSRSHDGFFLDTETSAGETAWLVGVVFGAGGWASRAGGASVLVASMASQSKRCCRSWAKHKSPVA